MARQEKQAVTNKQTLHLFSSIFSDLWDGCVALVCFYSLVTPCIYTERVYYHLHLQMVEDEKPSAPTGGHDEAKRTAVVGC